MCGVFGFVANEGETIKPESLAKIARTTETRGRHAWGVSWIDARDRIFMFKQAGQISDSIDKLTSLVKDAKMIVGHCRYATHGAPEQNINNHPFPCDGGWLVHNGVVSNYLELVFQFDLHIVSSCDSETIAQLAERAEGATMLERVQNAVDQVESSALAVMAIFPRPCRLIAIRRGNPLHYSETKRGIYLASLPAGMPGTAMCVRDNVGMELKMKGGKIDVRISETTASGK